MGQATQRWQEGPIFQALETLERQFREEHRGERVWWGVQVAESNLDSSHIRDVWFFRLW